MLSVHSLWARVSLVSWIRRLAMRLEDNSRRTRETSSLRETFVVGRRRRGIVPRRIVPEIVTCTRNPANSPNNYSSAVNAAAPTPLATLDEVRLMYFSNSLPRQLTFSSNHLWRMNCSCRVGVSDMTKFPEYLVLTSCRIIEFHFLFRD